MGTTEALNTFQQLASVRLAASSNQSGSYYNGVSNTGVGATFTYATGVLTIDSVVVALNDYVLLAAQTNAYENGIYQCTQAGATGVAAILTRRGDFQSREQIRSGHYIPVSAGTVNAGTFWTVVEPVPNAIGKPSVANANDILFGSVEPGGNFLPIAGGTMTGTLVPTKGTGSISVGAVTVNAQSGVITGTFTTAAAANTTVTLTNSAIVAGSNVLLTLQSLPNVPGVQLAASGVTSGSCVINVSNNNVAGTALSGSISIGFLVV